VIWAVSTPIWSATMSITFVSISCSVTVGSPRVLMTDVGRRI
jgi:hypothetical protein